MSRRLMLVLAAAVVVVAVAVTGGIAIAGGVGGDDQPLTGASLQKATAAALAHTGGGTVTESEVGDDGAAYDVEVRLANGKHGRRPARLAVPGHRPGGRRRRRDRR